MTTYDLFCKKNDFCVFVSLFSDHSLFQMVDYVAVNVKMNYLQPTILRKWFKCIYCMTLTFDLEKKIQEHNVRTLKSKLRAMTN